MSGLLWLFSPSVRSRSQGIAPTGFYGLEEGWEEDPEDKTPDPTLVPATEGEEYSPPTQITALTDGSGWVHYERQLLARQGKCSWYAFPVPEEEEPEEGAEPLPPKPEPETPEASATPLALLSADAPIGASSAPAWSFRAAMAGMGGSTVAVAKSVKWPGAVTVGELSGAIGLQWSSIYVGNGAAYEGAPFSPPLPPMVAEEADDLFEEQDPTVEEEEAANAPPAEEAEEEA